MYLQRALTLTLTLTWRTPLMSLREWSLHRPDQLDLRYTHAWIPTSNQTLPDHSLIDSSRGLVRAPNRSNPLINSASWYELSETEHDHGLSDDPDESEPGPQPPVVGSLETCSSVRRHTNTKWTQLYLQVRFRARILRM